MKNRYSIVLLLLCVQMLHAQTNNYISVWGDVGETSLLTYLKDYNNTISAGVGGGVGLGYELHKNKFILTTGLKANVFHTAFDLSNLEKGFSAIDNENDELIYYISANSRKDVYTDVSLQIPLMLGGQFNRFFFLLGAKFDMSLYATSKVKASLRTKGDYPQFFDPFEHMPEHGFYDDAPFEMKPEKIKFKPNVTASVEFGWELGEMINEAGFGVPKKNTIYRLSLFADYGLLDLHNRQNNNIFSWNGGVIDADAINNVVMSDVLSTDLAEKMVNNMVVGIKFTILFHIEHKHRICVICTD